MTSKLEQCSDIRLIIVTASSELYSFNTLPEDAFLDTAHIDILE
jgi:hypothetical protein